MSARLYFELVNTHNSMPDRDGIQVDEFPTCGDNPQGNGGRTPAGGRYQGSGAVRLDVERQRCRGTCSLLDRTRQPCSVMGAARRGRGTTNPGQAVQNRTRDATSLAAGRALDFATAQRRFRSEISARRGQSTFSRRTSRAKMSTCDSDREVGFTRERNTYAGKAVNLADNVQVSPPYTLSTRA
jgi:hypothetical protein